MPKRLLIVCDGFAAPLYGPRMTQLCKYLHQWGWDITVVTEQMKDEAYHIPDVRFLAMPYYQGNHYKQVGRWIADKCFHRKDKMLYRYMKQQISDISGFSLILCSSFNLFPLLAAQRLAKEADIPLVVDLRDITEQWGHSNYFAHELPLPDGINKWLISRFEKDIVRQRNMVLRDAAAVSTVSPWHKQVLQAIAPNTHLIYNGFDGDTYTPSAETTEQCIISYCGRFYDFGSRNPQYFLDAISELHQEGVISSKTLRIVFHIETYMIEPLTEWVKRLGIAEYFDISGYISQQEATKLLRRSAVSLLFVSAPSPTTTKGIMTTKFYEALGCEKPILCTPSDESVLAATIRQTHAGIATSDVDEIKTFVLSKYHEWQKQGYTRQEVTDREKFSREAMATAFEKLFLSIIK